MKYDPSSKPSPSHHTLTSMNIILLHTIHTPHITSLLLPVYRPCGKQKYFLSCASLGHEGEKYWGKQIFTHRRFPEVGQKQKTEEKKVERKLVITMAKLCMALASTHGACKPPGPKCLDFIVFFIKFCI